MKTFFLNRKSELCDNIKIVLRDIERENKDFKSFRYNNSEKNRNLKKTSIQKVLTWHLTLRRKIELKKYCLQIYMGDFEQSS